MMRFSPWLTSVASLLVAGCMTANAYVEPEASRTGAADGFAFASAHCSGCHAVSANDLSPNRMAPSFEAVVNKPGVTHDTLIRFLDDSHNYPDIMNFAVSPQNTQDLADYMLTLQHGDYRPIPR